MGLGSYAAFDNSSWERLGTSRLTASYGREEAFAKFTRNYDVRMCGQASSNQKSKVNVFPIPSDQPNESYRPPERFIPSEK